MLQMVAAGFEDIEGFVLDLPAGATTGGQVGDRLRRDGQIRDEGVVVGPLSLFVEDLNREPVDDEGVFGSAQRHIGQPAVDESAVALAGRAYRLSWSRKTGQMAWLWI